MRVLSLLPDRSMFGLQWHHRKLHEADKLERGAYFSREVASDVTQPLWPTNVPLSIISSAMVGRDPEAVTGRFEELS